MTGSYDERFRRGSRLGKTSSLRFSNSCRRHCIFYMRGPMSIGSLISS